jgi:hypothetical protein
VDLAGIAKALTRLTGLAFEEDETSKRNGKFYCFHDRNHGDFVLYRHIDIFGEYGCFNPRLEEFGVILEWEGDHPFPYHDAILALAEFSPELIDTFVQDDDSEEVLEDLSWFPEQNGLVDMRDRYRNANDPE